MKFCEGELIVDRIVNASINVIIGIISPVRGLGNA